MSLEWFQELWHYRGLFYFLAWRDVKVRYKQTVLGVVWAIIQPLLTMLIFLLMFSKLAKIPTDGTPPALFYYTALVPWIYFSSTIGLCGTSLIGNSNLITKVYFPREILPGAVALSGLVDFGVSGVLTAGFLLYFRITPDWHLLLLPFLICLLVMLTYGLGIILAAVTVKYRDIKYATPFLIQLGLFITPIIYPPSMLPEKYHLLLVLNPLSGIINSFRAILVPTQPMPWGLLGASVVVTILIFVFGTVYFQRSAESFADTI